MKKGVLLPKMKEMSFESVIQSIRSKAQEVLPSGATLLLFGSRARGEANEESDWDLLVLLDKDKLEQSDYDNYAFPFTDLGWDLNEMISPLIYARKTWEQQSFTPFYKNVEQDKMVLYGPQ